MKLENLNDQLMVTAAHRYCLGRRSYMVSSCVEWLIETWDQIEDTGKLVLLRDTADALMEDQAGGEIDKKEWHRLLQWGDDRLSEGHKTWLRNAVRQDKTFPLKD